MESLPLDSNFVIFLWRKVYEVEKVESPEVAGAWKRASFSL
jgi:hypothetical protein